MRGAITIRRKRWKDIVLALPTWKLIPLALLLTYVATLLSVVTVLVYPGYHLGGPSEE
jgi:hypothetical protein